MLGILFSILLVGTFLVCGALLVLALIPAAFNAIRRAL